MPELTLKRPLRLCAALACLALSVRATCAAGQPRNLVVSGLNDVFFRVSWTTADEVTGCLRYGTAPGQLDTTVHGHRGADYQGRLHSVVVSGLIPETVYYYRVVSGGTAYPPADGPPWSVTTGPTLDPGTPGVIFGRVLDPADGLPAEGVLAHFRFERNGVFSTFSSSVTDGDGYWQGDISRFRTEDLQAGFDPERAGDFFRLVLHGAGRGSLEVAWPADQVMPDPGGGPIPSPEATLGAQAPFLDPLPGAYPGPVEVTVTYPGPETPVTVRYTTDGSLPVDGSALYAGPVPLEAGQVFRARAWVDGLAPSAGVGGAYLAASFPPGDINHDGVVDEADVILVLHMAAGLPVEVGGVVFEYPYGEPLFSRANLAGGESIDIADALAAWRLFLGLPAD